VDRQESENIPRLHPKLTTGLDTDQSSFSLVRFQTQPDATFHS
jgi:hypothetical protein